VDVLLLFLLSGRHLDDSDEAGHPAQEALFALLNPAAKAIDDAVGSALAVVENSARYARFDEYDFDNDAEFQLGMQSILGKEDMVPGNRKGDQLLLNSKLFYYDKCVEPLDRTGYVRRKAEHAQAAQLSTTQGESAGNVSNGALPPHLPTTTATIATNAAIAGSATAAVGVGTKEPGTMPPPQRVSAVSKRSETKPLPTEELGVVLKLDHSPEAELAQLVPEAESEPSRLSFAEVMAYVERGMDVPGTRKVEVQVAEDEPQSASTMRPRLKPWETEKVELSETDWKEASYVPYSGDSTNASDVP
jgi:hypothetical protein